MPDTDICLVVTPSEATKRPQAVDLKSSGHAAFHNLGSQDCIDCSINVTAVVCNAFLVLRNLAVSCVRDDHLAAA